MFLAPGTGFTEDNSSMEWRGNGLGMTQEHYMYCALSFYYYCQFHLRSSGIRAQKLGTLT